MKIDRNKSDYPNSISAVIFRIGNFNYREYLKKELTNYAEEDLNLPHLEPYLLPDGTIYVG